jgi:hypothetical protein
MAEEAADQVEAFQVLQAVEAEAAVEAVADLPEGLLPAVADDN